MLAHEIEYFDGDTGPSGWVREDVDNNGQVYFDDLIAVVMEYGEWWK